ncbi:MAG: leucine-rich repeat domain-containing protein [Lachnospiraceae bacterium]|nr:leucine-rich repeat domain-containing protein [Lachnospiraceae bacterium]
MKRVRKGELFFLIVFFLLPILPLQHVEAGTDTALMPTASNNLQVNLRRTSQLVATDGGYMRIYYRKETNTVGIEYYDSAFHILSKKTISMELELWGGFYAGSDAYYLVEGQYNVAESDTAEVIRVIKYDRNWNRIGAAKITGNPDLFGGEVRIPFNTGCVECTEYNGKLYVVTGHEGYVDENVGQGHQGFLMIAIDITSMTGKVVKSDLSHSFAQFIENQGSDLYVLEQSEGHHCTQLSKLSTDTFKGEALSVLHYGGVRTSSRAINCFASVDGLALSSDHVLCLGTSIDQSQYDNVTRQTAHNIYLTVTPKENFTEEATKVIWLTNYIGEGKSFLGTHITKINDNRFLIMWEEYNTKGTVSSDDSLTSSLLHYIFVDGEGNRISREFTDSKSISDCQPIVNGSKVVYYASNGNIVDFYSIDSQTGVASKKIFRIMGEHATWDYSDGVLTISGSGKTSTDEDIYRTPISTALFGISNFNKMWSHIEDQVEKIVIQAGIQSIGERTFQGLESYTEVVIEPGLKEIKKEAFYGCNKLKKIEIPSSVTTLGDSILWTGECWAPDLRPVQKAAIYTEDNSAAMDYAITNKLKYYISLDSAKISGLEANYVYEGKRIEPSPIVKIGDHILEKDTDYSVTYQNNDKIGTATVIVEGSGQYSGGHYLGTLTADFQIVAPAQKTNPADSGTNLVARGTKHTDSKTRIIYKVTKQGAAVALMSGKNVKASTVTIPAKIKLKGVTYKVTSISANAFKNNKKVKKVVISSNITSIGSSAFSGCTSLRTMQIGTGVKTIGAKAFYNCTNLTSIKIQTMKLTSKSIGSKAFQKAGKKNYKKLSVKVPKKKVSVYKKLLRKKGLSTKAVVKK